MQRKVIAVSFYQALGQVVLDLVGAGSTSKNTPNSPKTTSHETSGVSPVAFVVPTARIAPVVFVQPGTASSLKQGMHSTTGDSLTKLLSSLAKLQAQMLWQMILRWLIEMRETQVKVAKDSASDDVAEVQSFSIKLRDGIKARISILLNSIGETLGRNIRFTPTLDNPDLDEALPV